jgi:hypothetical protein
MQDHEQCKTAAYILTRMHEIERELRRLPGRMAQLPPAATRPLWREMEASLTEYMALVLRYCEMGGPAGACTEPRAWDLSRYSDDLRDAIYEAVVAVHWDAPPEHPDDFVPAYTPEDAGLQVVYFLGRWFAVWRQLEEPHDIPPAQRWEILRVEANPSSRFGLSFTGV